jgi:hypothetical protein
LNRHSPGPSSRRSHERSRGRWPSTSAETQVRGPGPTTITPLEITTGELLPIGASGSKPPRPSARFKSTMPSSPNFWTGRPGAGVERHEPKPGRDDDNARILSDDPVADATSGVAARRAGSALALVERPAPPLGAGGGVEGDDIAVDPGRHVEGPVDVKWRRLVLELRLRPDRPEFALPCHAHAATTLPARRGTPGSMNTRCRRDDAPVQGGTSSRFITTSGDYDNTTAPTLIDVQQGGRTARAVAPVTKRAFTDVFDRVTGDPLWPIVERPVPPSDVPGERAAKTQPFPTKPPAFDRQGVMLDDLVDFTPEIRARAVEALKGYRLGAMYQPAAFLLRSAR